MFSDPAGIEMNTLRNSLALGDAVGAGALDEGAEAAPEVGHVVDYHLRHEGGPVADGVRDGVVAVVRVDLHRLHDPRRRRVDQLRVAARVAVVALAELAPRVLLEDWKCRSILRNHTKVTFQI